MSWFWLALIALICWSGSDLFSKIGCADEKDKYSHLKMVIAVGTVMGIHAAWTLFVDKILFPPDVILKYLPVSALYILSMAIGYLGLRYIELSISSPICNSSGALVAILCICTGQIMLAPQYIAVALICVGVVLLGVAEMREDDELRRIRQEKSNRKYTKSAIALILPIVYCLLDALGTFADDIFLENLEKNKSVLTLIVKHAAKTGSAVTETYIENSVANMCLVSYELTFLFCAVVCFIYVKFIKKQKFFIKAETPKYIGGTFETVGQIAYTFAIARSGQYTGAAAAMISSYCAVSVLWSRIFLKERLSWKHYCSILIAVVGIVILGIFDEL